MVLFTCINAVNIEVYGRATKSWESKQRRGEKINLIRDNIILKLEDRVNANSHNTGGRDAGTPQFILSNLLRVDKGNKAALLLHFVWLVRSSGTLLSCFYMRGSAHVVNAENKSMEEEELLAFSGRP